MRQLWTPPARWVFGAATALGLFSFLQAYQLSAANKINQGPHDAAKLVVLNLALWFIPALMLPGVVTVAQRFPFDTGRRLRAVAIHVASALVFAAVLLIALTGVRLLLWTDTGTLSGSQWLLYLERLVFEQLDWTLMVYAVIVGVSHAIAYYRESQDRKVTAAQLETRLMEARLKTLEAELHPHFLFNTLHAVSTLVHRDPDAADRMISRLSDLLRITFDRSGEARISLKEEIEFLQKYLDIEQTRFQDRLTVSVEIDPIALDAEVPRMILQPLVENALKHGIAGRNGGDRVQIAAGLDAGRLWMQVRDNGGGLQTRTLQALRTGVGLANTRARLECMYGRHYRLEFSDTRGGLCVLVNLPYHRVAGPPAPAADFRVA